MMRIDNQIISYFSPDMALKREFALKKTEYINSGYSHHGASRFKKSLLGWIFKSGSPDEDITKNIKTLRERTRDLYMGVPIATGVIKTARTNIIGSGLILKPQIDGDFLGISPEEARAKETEIKREFSLWADSTDCDASRTCDFGQLQALAFLSMWQSGDVFAVLPYIKRKNSPYGLAIRLIEADRVCNPNNMTYPDEKILEGVEIGSYGEPVAYHIARKHPGGANVGVNEWDRIPAFGNLTGRRNVIHLFEAERPEQRRGVPILAPVIEALKQLGRYTDAELMAAVVSGLFTVFIQSDTPDNPISNTIPDDQKVDDDENSLELGNGAVLALRPGETANTANPGRPNQAFDPFVMAIIRQIGAALEIPYELLIKHFTASYSASRAALLEAWKMFRMRRDWMARRFCQPIYEEWFMEAVALGRIYAPGFFSDPAVRKAYCGAEWHGPSQGQLDPLKEANAAKVRVEQCFSTRAREAAEISGSDYDTIINDRIQEEKLRKEGGLVIETSNSKGGNANVGSDEG